MICCNWVLGCHASADVGIRFHLDSAGSGCLPAMLTPPPAGHLPVLLLQPRGQVGLVLVLGLSLPLLSSLPCLDTSE